MNLKVWMDRWMFVYLLEGISETETFVFFYFKGDCRTNARYETSALIRRYTAVVT